MRERIGSQCLVCGEELPKGRRVYCSPRCHHRGRAIRDQIQADQDPEYRRRKAEYAAAYRATHEAKPRDRRDEQRRKNLARYGLTPEQYDAMELEQGGVCKVCGRPETVRGSHGEVKRMAVDHCHETGRVRGLLCARCNQAIGLLGDDPVRMQGVIRYLESFLTLP